MRSGLAEAGLATAIKLLLQPLAAWFIPSLFVDLASVPGIAVKQNSASVLLSTAFSVITVSALLVLLRVS
jgi:malonate transporter